MFNFDYLRVSGAKIPAQWRVAGQYGFAILMVGLATVGRKLLDPFMGDTVPYVTYFLSTAVVIRYSGRGPSLLAIFLAALAADWFFLSPRYTLWSTPSQYVTSGIFIAANLLVLALACAMRSAKTRTEANAKALAERTTQLETLLVQREQAESALRQSEQQFRFLIESIPHIVWSARPDGFLDYVNARALDYGGKSLEQLAGWNWVSVLHPEDAQRTKQAWAESVARGNEYRIEYRLQRGTDGQYRWFQAHALPLRGTDGQIRQWFGTCTDIHDRKTAEEALSANASHLEQMVQERTAKLRELVGELEHFSYSITHDLRAPLRSLQGFSRMMLMQGCVQCANPISKDFLNRIATSAERMDALITDALQYTKAVQAVLELTPLDVAALLRGMLDSYPQFQPEQAEIVLHGEFPPVMGNQAALTQCFSNLLSNAVKFVEPGVRPRIRIRAEPKAGTVRLWFEDNGIGIPREQRPKIFNMFHRVANDYEGTGIGLALVRKNAEKMSGSVGVESELGQGSRFWLELKRADVVSETKCEPSIASYEL